MKVCAFCDFSTDDLQAFSDHVRVQHGWNPQPERRSVFRWLLLPGLIVPMLAFGACGAFFLAYNALPPFQVSDDTGNQSELKRAVPGAVRYTDGWIVAVDPPSSARSTDGLSVWIIPIAFTSDVTGGTIGVGSCQFTADGALRDAHSEPAEVQLLGNNAETHRFAARGETWRARLAVSRPAAKTRRAELRCWSRGRTQATFDLTPFLASLP